MGRDTPNLSTTFSTQYACGPKLLQYVHPDHLAWGHRKPLIVSELTSIDADLCCLQEVDTGRWAELLALLPGYEGILQEKKGLENGSACALLYKPGTREAAQSRHTTSAVHSVTLIHVEERCNICTLYVYTGFGPAHRDPPTPLLACAGRLEALWTESRSRSLLAAFRFHDSSGAEHHLWLINCHLEGSPYRPTDRVSQMRSALQRLQQCQQQQAGVEPRDCTVVVAGDFNSGRAESVWRLLSR